MTKTEISEALNILGGYPDAYEYSTMDEDHTDRQIRIKLESLPTGRNITVHSTDSDDNHDVEWVNGSREVSEKAPQIAVYYWETKLNGEEIEKRIAYAPTLEEAILNAATYLKSRFEKVEFTGQDSAEASVEIPF